MGREEELGQLNEVLHKSISGSGGFVLISGEAGIGKTRLATEFERDARQLGCRVLFGSCLPSAQIPYLVFLEAFNDLFFDPMEKEKGHDPRLQRSKSSSDRKAGAAKDRTLRATAALFKEYSEGTVDEGVGKEHVLFKTLEVLKKESLFRPLIIHLDDLQWADSMSIGMLHFLARNIRDIRVMLLGTCRSEEIMNKEAGIHPFLESVRIMKRENLLKEIALRPLAECELNDIVTGMMEHPVSETVLDRIFKESGGSPLFAVETIRLLEGSGALVLKDGRWNVSGSIEHVIPSSVKEVMLRRIERTSKEERKALDYASVIGLTFNPELLADALRRDKLLLLENLEHLETDHKLVREVEAGFCFTHAKLREFTYDGISSLRRKEIHRAVGTLIEKQLPNDALLPELAVHFYSAADLPRAVNYSYLAGRFCIDRWAVSEALPFFQRAVELGPKVEGFEHIRLDAMEGLADAMREEGQAAAAADLYERMVTDNVAGLQKARVLRKLSFIWSPLVLGKGSKDRSMGYIESARNVPEIDADEEGEIASLLTVLNMLEGDYLRAKEQAKLSADGFRVAMKWKKLSLQLLYNADVYLSTGEIDEALRIVREAEELNRGVKDPLTGMEVDFHLGMAYLHQGKKEEALTHYNAYADMCKKMGFESAVAIVYFYESILMSLAGDQKEAIRFAQNSKDIADKLNRPYLKAGSTSALAHAYYMAGDKGSCAKFAAMAQEIANGFDKGVKTANIGMVRLADAEWALVKDDWDEADAMFREAIAIFQATAIGKLMEALSLKWYGQALRNHGYFEMAGEEMSKAVQIFVTMGNEPMEKECNALIMNVKITDTN